MSESSLELTRLSERGQVVIPTELRKRMKLREGERFVVMGLGDTIILRKLELSQERSRLKKLIADAHGRRSKTGFTEKEIRRLIQAARKGTA